VSSIHYSPTSLGSPTGLTRINLPNVHMGRAGQGDKRIPNV